jgi:hypothetical protein
MAVFTRHRQAPPPFTGAAAHLTSACRDAPALQTFGMTWGTTTAVIDGPRRRADLDAAVTRRGVVSGRCAVELVLHRRSSRGNADAVAVLLDRVAIGHLPPQAAAR